MNKHRYEGMVECPHQMIKYYVLERHPFTSGYYTGVCLNRNLFTVYDGDTPLWVFDATAQKWFKVAAPAPVREGKNLRDEQLPHLYLHLAVNAVAPPGVEAETLTPEEILMATYMGAVRTMEEAMA